MNWRDDDKQLENDVVIFSMRIFKGFEFDFHSTKKKNTILYGKNKIVNEGEESKLKNTFQVRKNRRNARNSF